MPLAWRRMTQATKPITASVVTRMSSGAVSGKNMSQNESLAPSGRAPYFMSVMYWWLPTNGPIQNIGSRIVAAPTPRPYRKRRMPSMLTSTITSAARTV